MEPVLQYLKIKSKVYPVQLNALLKYFWICVIACHSDQYILNLNSKGIALASVICALTVQPSLIP